MKGLGAEANAIDAVLRENSDLFFGESSWVGFYGEFADSLSFVVCCSLPRISLL